MESQANKQQGASDAASPPDPGQALLELSAIFENASIGIVVTRDRAIQRCNHRAAEMFGFASPEDMAGRPGMVIYPDEESYARLGAVAGPLLAAGESFHSDWLLCKHDATPVWCNLYGKAVDPLNTRRGTVWIMEDISAAKAAEAELRKSTAVLEDTLEYMDQGISIVDAELQLLVVNRRYRELLDFPESLCRPGTSLEAFYRYNAERGEYGPGDVEGLVRTRMELARRFEPHRFERERKDGTVIEVRGTPVPGRGFVTIYTDITQRGRAERALRESEARFRNLTELSSDWFWEQDTEYRFVRQEGRHVSGDDTAFEREHGQTSWELGYEIEVGWDAHRALLARHEPFRDAILHRRLPDGTLHYIRVSGAPVFDGEGRFIGYRGVGRDITDQKLAQERIQYLATHDGLTELPNRVLFHELLNLAIESGRRYERALAVLFIDLDRFKIINDTLGHEAGDLLLKETATRLRQVLRSSDVVARLGGDEFVVLVQEVGEREQAAAVARKVLSTVIRPMMIQGQECRVTASIGICMFPGDGENEPELMKNADIAMYLAKEEGKNNFQFYSPQIRTQSLERLTFETELRRALERDEFSLHYQAKLDLRNGSITGVEALLRWQHPVIGPVSPAQFIPLAEETGLIVPIGKWVLKTACSQNVAWQRAGLPSVCMAVNLSPRQFADENLLQDIDTVLRETGMNPQLLELEITESMVMGNIERAARQLSAIKLRGVRLAIDDFGTGYSSLAQIKRFPIDTLKVDRSFIRELQSNAEDRAITQAIIAMGKTLSLTVVAEGVENREQQAFLREQACDEMQGFYFSKPLPPNEFADLIQHHRSNGDQGEPV